MCPLGYSNRWKTKTTISGGFLVAGVRFERTTSGL